MKQNLKSTTYARSQFTLVILALMLSTSACATRPRYASSSVQLHSDIPTVERASLININTAIRSELEKLPGVGKVIAERIVTHREQYGPFRRAEHLLMVRGISDRKFRELRSLIVVE